MPEESWVGFELDDESGSRVGSVRGYFDDAESGEPAWLVVGVGRRRVKLIAVPLADCAGAAGRVWVAHAKATLRAAPAVDPQRPLLREHEMAICTHFGIGKEVGRAAEVAGRDEGAVTAKPAAG